MSKPPLFAAFAGGSYTQEAAAADWTQLRSAPVAGPSNDAIEDEEHKDALDVSDESSSSESSRHSRRSGRDKSASKDESRKRRREKKEKKGDKKDKEHKKHRHKHKRRTQDTDTQSTASAAPKKYYFDSKGDRNNRVYDSLYRADVAAYRRSTRGCLGLVGDDRERFARTAFKDPRELQIVSVASMIGGVDSAAGRYHASGAVPRNALKCVPMTHKTATGVRVTGPLPEFIHVAYEKAPTEREDDAVSMVSSVNYGLITLTSRRSDSASVSGFSLGGGSVGGEESVEDYIRRRTREFSESTRNSPKDIALWLAFAAFQDEITRLGKRSIRANTKAFAEKKMSIFERALLFNPHSEELWSGRLAAAPAVLDESKVASLWRQALVLLPQSVRLWDEFVWYRQSLFTGFKVSAVREDYAKAVQAVAAEARRERVRARKAAASDPTINVQETWAAAAALELAVIRLVVRYCAFERAAGYTERAVGVFQALVEFTCFRPDILNRADPSARYRYFTAFWESEVPRVGEDNSQGWAAWLLTQITGEEAKAIVYPAADGAIVDEEGEVERDDRRIAQERREAAVSAGAGGSSEASVPDVALGADLETLEQAVQETEEATEAERMEANSEDEAVAPPSPDDIAYTVYARWGQMERERTLEQYLPLRMLAEDDKGEQDTDDPDRTVLYDDVEAFLVELGLPESRAELFNQFIEFMGVRISALTHSSLDRLVEEQTLHRERTGAMFASLDDPSRLPSLFGLPSESGAVQARSGLETRMYGAADGVDGLSHFFKTSSNVADQVQNDFGLLTPAEIVEKMYQQQAKTAQRNAAHRVDWGDGWVEIDVMNESIARFVQRALILKCSIPVVSDVVAAAALQTTHRLDGVAGARKLAKRLLKNERDNLALWHAYADMEARFGHTVEARRVLDTALTMHHKRRLASTDEPLLPLFRAYALLEFDACGGGYGGEAAGAVEQDINTTIQLARARALMVTVAAMESSFTSLIDTTLESTALELSPMRSLKVGHAYAQKLSALGERPTLHGAADFAACIVLFEYFSKGLDDALAAVDSVLGCLVSASKAKFRTDEDRSREIERVHVLHARIVYTHTFVFGNAAPPGLLRDALERGLARFPTSPLLLSLYIESESRFSAANRLRRYFDRVSNKSMSPQLLLFALRSEARRPGAAYRIRSLFEKALSGAGRLKGGTTILGNNTRIQSSVLIWRLYLQFELSQHRRKRAVAVMYRAIRQCPWARRMFIDAFLTLTQVKALKVDELGGLRDIMSEKELRVRTELSTAIYAEELALINPKALPSTE